MAGEELLDELPGVKPLRAALRASLRPAASVGAKRIAEQLRDAGRLFMRTGSTEQRRFVQEVFDRIVVSGEEVTELEPRPDYKPFFVADRERRFAGDYGKL